jgi:hypothetical protein
MGCWLKGEAEGERRRRRLGGDGGEWGLGGPARGRRWARTRLGVQDRVQSPATEGVRTERREGGRDGGGKRQRHRVAGGRRRAPPGGRLRGGKRGTDLRGDVGRRRRGRR